MSKRNQPGCPCCGCDYHFDDFNRSSSTNVGGDYTETSGDWSIVDFGGGEGSLLIQNANAVLTVDVAHPGAEANGVVGFAFYAFHAGDQVRWLFDYADADNYYFVQVTVGSSGTLAIYQRSGGTNTLLESTTVNAPAGQFLSLFVYWGERCGGETGSYVLAYMPDDAFNPDEALVAVETSGFSNDAKALATGNLTSGIYFDQFTLWKHSSESSASCPCAPQRSCGGDTQPDVVLSGAAFTCPNGQANGPHPFYGRYDSIALLPCERCLMWHDNYDCWGDEFIVSQFYVWYSCQTGWLRLFMQAKNSLFDGHVSIFGELFEPPLEFDDLGRLTGTCDIDVTWIDNIGEPMSDTLTLEFNGG